MHIGLKYNFRKMQFIQRPANFIKFQRFTISIFFGCWFAGGRQLAIELVSVLIVSLFLFLSLLQEETFAVFSPAIVAFLCNDIQTSGGPEEEELS